MYRTWGAGGGFPDPNGIRNNSITAFQPLGVTSQSDEMSVKRELERVMGIEVSTQPID